MQAGGGSSTVPTTWVQAARRGTVRGTRSWLRVAHRARPGSLDGSVLGAAAALGGSCSHLCVSPAARAALRMRSAAPCQSGGPAHVDISGAVFESMLLAAAAQVLASSTSLGLRDASGHTDAAAADQIRQAAYRLRVSSKLDLHSLFGHIRTRAQHASLPRTRSALAFFTVMHTCVARSADALLTALCRLPQDPVCRAPAPHALLNPRSPRRCSRRRRGATRTRAARV